MTERLKVWVEKRDPVAVLTTEGYINNEGGEEIARVATGLLDEGYRKLLLNLKGTKIVNSIGISILIEVLERMLELEGEMAFCCLTSTIQKTFHIMGLTQFATIYQDETEALTAMGGVEETPE